MKLNRELVISKLEERIARSEKYQADRVVKAQKVYDKAEAAVQKLLDGPTIKLGTRAYLKLRDAQRELDRTWNPATEAYRDYNGERSERFRENVRREIGLLKLSTDETVNIRVNSDLASWLSS